MRIMHFSDKLSQLIVGDIANPIVAPIATGFPILTGRSFIRGLAGHSPLTISNTSGSAHFLLGMDTLSIPAKANASVVCYADRGE